METTLPRLLFASAERFGEASAVEDGELRWSFAELEQRALAAARAFIASGLGRGDRVALWAPNRAEWIQAALGVHCAGGAIVPLNTRLKGPEAAYILRKSRARALCTVGEFLDTRYVEALADEDVPALELMADFDGGQAGALAWEEFVARGARVTESEVRTRALAVDAEDMSDLLFTSGTTGNPKGVIASHGQTLRAFASWSEVVGLRQGDRYLIVNPFFHSFGYKAGWLACLMQGATALPHPVFDVEAIFERVSRERVSVLPGPPTVYQSFLAHPDRAEHDLSNLRLAVTGAAPTPVELIRRMRTELGFETIITGYGLTECCGIVSMCRYDDEPETIATTSGRALPDVEVRCVDADGKEVPRGEPGEVLVRGYNVMRGYFDDEAETRKTIDADGWLHTGDVAVMNERGYLRITDRIKDMFIVGGFNCYPAEIENALFGSGRFAQVAVIGIPDERMGEVGMAFVVPAPGEAIEPESVIAWSRENMANYKVPRRVAVMDALPTNASGKVTKFALREWARENPA
ncbi:MAG: FadD3 family acyl-CoA ligase [Proteobacteria bacterium]|nr:FadD3 family acyl-CoA ligase [Pseudomonadota bacterium]